MKKIYNIVPDICKSRRAWDVFANDYSSSFEVNNIELGIAMLDKINNLGTMENVIETGAGTGLLSLNIYNSIKNNCKLYTITDFSENMTNIIKSRFSNNKNIEIITIDSQLLSKLQRDNYYDAYISNLSFHLLCDFDKAANEAYKILKDNGTFAITIFGKEEESPYFKIFYDLLSKYNLLYKDRESHTERLRSYFYLTEDFVIKSLKNIGFNNINLTYKNIYYKLDDDNIPINLITSPQGKMYLNKLDGQSYDNFISELKLLYENTENCSQLNTLIVTANK